MAKKVEGYIKLQIAAGKATPAPPLDRHSASTELTSLNSPSSSTLRQHRWVTPSFLS